MGLRWGSYSGFGMKLRTWRNHSTNSPHFEPWQKSYEQACDSQRQYTVLMSSSSQSHSVINHDPSELDVYINFDVFIFDSPNNNPTDGRRLSLICFRMSGVPSGISRIAWIFTSGFPLKPIIQPSKRTNLMEAEPVWYLHRCGSNSASKYVMFVSSETSPSQQLLSNNVNTKLQSWVEIQYVPELRSA